MYFEIGAVLVPVGVFVGERDPSWGEKWTCYLPNVLLLQDLEAGNLLDSDRFEMVVGLKK